MKLGAYVRNRYSKECKMICDDHYRTKKDFKVDLKANGYTVIQISNLRDIECQNHGYENFSQMFPKCLLKMYQKNTELWSDELALYEQIKNMEV